MQTFLKDYPKKVVLLHAALRAKDSSALAATAHALKGPISIFDGAQARQAAEELQDAAKNGQLAQAAKTLGRLEEEIAKLDEKLRGYTTRGTRAQSGNDKGKRGVRAKKKRAKREGMS